MLSTKSQQSFFLLLPTLFLTSSTFLSLLQGAASEFHHITNKQIEGHIVIRGTERLVLEGKNKEANSSSILILAAERTHRKDPLDHFNYYTGGWDYKNSHYWASVSFSAAPLFIIAVVWFLLLGLSLCCACLCCCCCCKKRKYGYSPIAYALSLIFLIFSTTAVTAGSIVLYVNHENFNNCVADMLEFILQKAISIFHHLMSIFTALASASKISIDQINLPPDIRNQIDTVDQMINSTANLPQIQSMANAKNIQHVLRPARLALNMVAAVMLFLAFLGFSFSILGLQCCIYILVILGWILVAFAFILSGIFLIFSNAVADTCVAVDDWLQNPTANASLSLQFLPCTDNKTAQETLRTAKETSSYLINVVNKYIIEVANKDLPPAAGVFYHNQSGPVVPLLCNPINSDLTARNCDSAEVNFKNVAEEWRKHVCQVSAAGVCDTAGRLTPNVYNQMTASVNVSYSLYSSSQFLVDLADCSFVLKTFSEISENYCPGLRRYSFRTYVGLVIVAASSLYSLILWMVYGRERRHRKYTKKLIASNPLAGGRA